MPDRFITPKRATYLVLGCVVVLAGVLYWNYTLQRDLSDARQRIQSAEDLRASEERATKERKRLDKKQAEARADQGCGFLVVLNDVSISIPVMNLNDILEGSLTVEERAKRASALGRYKKAEAKFAVPLKQCAAREKAKKKAGQPK